LRDLKIIKPNHVWSSDITYIKFHGSFVYLAAVIDWYSRKVLSWRLSTTLDSSFCVDALNESLDKYGKPEFFNTDQGSQFTSDAFTGVLKSHFIKISMDGKGRALDNVFMERFWRTIKYEHIYLWGFDTVSELRESVGHYIQKYNHERGHQSLDEMTPDAVYNEVYYEVISA
jgi:putative transposase